MRVSRLKSVCLVRLMAIAAVAAAGCDDRGGVLPHDAGSEARDGAPHDAGAGAADLAAERDSAADAVTTPDGEPAGDGSPVADATETPDATSPDASEAGQDGVPGAGVALTCRWTGDFDGDGVSDCARTQAGASTLLDLVFNKGIGTNLYAGSGVISPNLVPADAMTLVIFDLDHDSRQDIIVGRPTSMPGPSPGGSKPFTFVQRFRGQSNGTFLPDSSPELLVPGDHWRQVGVADFDGDGFPDVLMEVVDATVLYYPYYWVLFRSRVDDQLPAVESLAFAGIRSGSTRTEIVDLDGDGKTDIVSAGLNNLGLPTNPNRFFSYLGRADGAFHGVDIGAMGALWPTWFAVADLDRDGKPDLIVDVYLQLVGSGGNRPNKLVAMLGHGDGTFGAPIDFPGNSYAEPAQSAGLPQGRMTVTDVNADGAPDVIVQLLTNFLPSNQLVTFLGKGDGTFQDGIPVPGADGGDALAIGDFNGDGKVDVSVLFLGRPTLDPTPFYGDGAGHFSTTPPP